MPVRCGNRPDADRFGRAQKPWHFAVPLLAGRVGDAENETAAAAQAQDRDGDFELDCGPPACPWRSAI